MNIDASQIGEIYDTYGEYYHESRRTASGRLANEFIDMPAVLSLVPADLTGSRVLDAGCGSGLYATVLAKRGAKVTGVDASRKMIEIAERERPENCDISYSIGDIADLPVSDGFFDLVVCCYVLENVYDIGAVFAEFRRVMKPGGSCVISISHPLRAQAVRETDAGEETWRIRDYFERGKRQSDFGGGMIVPKYRRPLEDYAEAATSAGLLIKRLLEPRPIAGGEIVDPSGCQKAMRLPQLLVMEATRVAEVSR